MEFDKIKNKIYPWIKIVYQPGEEPPGSSSEIELAEEDTPVYQEWLGGLAIFYAIDEGSNFRLMLNRDIPEDRTIDELHEIAVENLERDVEFKFNETVFGGYGLIAGGDHEAGSICLDGIWHWCADQLKDNLVVAVPAKDMVMMVPASDREKIKTLKEFSLELFKDGDRLLTKQLFYSTKKIIHGQNGTRLIKFYIVNGYKGSKMTRRKLNWKGFGVRSHRTVQDTKKLLMTVLYQLKIA